MRSVEDLRIQRLAMCSTYVLSLVVIISVCIGCQNQDRERQRQVFVFAAASTMEAVEEIVDRHQVESNLLIRSNFSASSTLATQIVNGAKADIFLSANLDWIKELEKRGYIHSSKKSIGNQLVLVVPTRSINGWKPAGLEDLVDKRIRRISIADPDSVPSGIYAKRALERTGIWESVKGKLVYGAHVRQALAQVESGNIDVGIVYATDAKTSDSVEVISRIDLGMTGPIDYGLALTAYGHSNPRAVKLFENMCNQESMEIFERQGFLKGVDAD